MRDQCGLTAIDLSKGQEGAMAWHAWLQAASIILCIFLLSVEEALTFVETIKVGAEVSMLISLYRVHGLVSVSAHEEWFGLPDGSNAGEVKPECQRCMASRV